MSGTALRSAAIWLLLTFAIRAAGADNIAATVVTPGGEGGTVFSTQGWSFTPVKNLRVSRLGVFDTQGDGLAQAHEVGIWTDGGTLVVSATVPAGSAAPIAGGTRFVDIPATVLGKNQAYVIGTYYLDGSDTILNDGLNNTVLAYDPAITAGAGRSGINQFAGLDFPPTSSGLPRLGPNFTFTIAADRTWPTGAAPCDDINDLAACLEGADDGDIVEIEANAIPAQSVDVNAAKSFTLRPAGGFTPVFADYSSFYVPGGDGDVDLVIEGLTLARGSMRIGGGSGTLHVTIRNNVFQGTGNSEGIEIANRSGPTVFDIAGNQISVNAGPTDYVSSIIVWGLENAATSGQIRGNRIVQVGGGQNGAIDIYANIGNLDVDVIGNQVSGTDFNHGVGVFPQGTGHVNARIVNNVISGQVNYAGGPAAIAMYVSEGSADFEVINNTVAYNETGIQLGGRPDLGAAVTAVISNNIVAFNTGAGMNLQDFPDTTINDFNLVHGNGSDEYVPGPGTLTVDPLFLDPGDLRTAGGSPVQDTGSSSRVPADITTDVEGSARIQGIVDRGAFEQAAGGSDVDSDGIADGLDNCTLVANANQRDTNGDGYGNVCDADLNDSGGLVNFGDLALFRVAFGALNADADLDGSGDIVNYGDLALFRALFGKAPGPSGLVP